MLCYNYGEIYPIVTELNVTVNDMKCEVYETKEYYFCAFYHKENIELKVNTTVTIGQIQVSPKRLDIQPVMEAQGFVLGNIPVRHLYIHIEGIKKPLLIHGNRQEPMKEKATYHYEAGKIYKVGNLLLNSHESVCIEGGAVMIGSIHTVKNATNIKIYGQGILDASCHAGTENRTILLDCSKEVSVQDITILNTPVWNIMVAGCENVVIDNVKEISDVVGSDGVDIVGSVDVTVKNCFFCNNDDSIAVKAFYKGCCNGMGDMEAEEAPSGWDRPIRDILVKDCLFANGLAGNMLEIGHEVQTAEIYNILFTGIDGIKNPGFGSSLALHVGDRAFVHDVTFSHIWIEDYEGYLMDFRVMKSMYNKDRERGRIKNILIEHLYITEKKITNDIAVSVIGGYDETHLVEDITFRHIYKNHQLVEKKEELNIFENHTKNVRVNR